MIHVRGDRGTGLVGTLTMLALWTARIERGPKPTSQDDRDHLALLLDDYIAYVAEYEGLRIDAAAELLANDYVVQRARRKLHKRTRHND